MKLIFEGIQLDYSRCDPTPRSNVKRLKGIKLQFDEDEILFTFYSKKMGSK